MTVVEISFEKYWELRRQESIIDLNEFDRKSAEYAWKFQQINIDHYKDKSENLTKLLSNAVNDIVRSILTINSGIGRIAKKVFTSEIKEIVNEYNKETYGEEE